MAIASELNDLSALCERAREDAGNEAERCAHCIVFGNARRCVETRLKITEALLDGEMDEARAATMAVVAQIAGARPRDSV